MAVNTNVTVSQRVVAALFDSDAAARRAVGDLEAAGIPGRHIERTAQTGSGEGTGFWDGLRDFFMPDEDRHSYGEGLKRGGVLVTVTTEDGNYHRVLGILDTDGAVDLDERENAWRREGWTNWSGQGDSTARTDGSGTSLDADRRAAAVLADPERAAGSLDTPRPRDTNWRTDEIARAAALDGSVAATQAAARRATRDTDLTRTRLRSYTVRADRAEAFSAARDGSKIAERMEVICADGQSIGIVDHLDGPDRIKLTRSSSPDGQHHTVPFAWIDRVDDRVHLNRTLAEIDAGGSGAAT